MRTLALAGCVMVLTQWSLHRSSAAELQVKENLVYCKVGDTELKLDLYRPDTEEKLPAVVVIHGGGWKGGNKESMRGIARNFAGAGFVAATVQYRLAPAAKFPAQVEDVKCAVRWLRSKAAEFNLDPEKVGATGASAGGHLALMLGLMDPKDGLEGEGGHADQSSKVQAVVNYFGPFDLTRRDWDPRVDAILVDFLGGTFDEKQDEYRLASPASYADSADPPVLSFHGDKDNIVPYTQATWLDELLKKKMIDSTLVTVEGAGHGWFGPKLTETQQQATKFFIDHLVGTK